MVVAETRFQIVWKEEKAEYQKHHRQLYQNNFPQGFAQYHAAETVGIEAENP